MLVEKQVSCPYCGKQKFLSVEPDIPAEKLEEMVVESCDCDAALAACGMKETEKAIQEYLKEGSDNHGYPYEIADDTVGIIRHLCKSILDGHLDKVSLVEPKGDTIKLKKNGAKVEINRIFKIDCKG